MPDYKRLIGKQSSVKLTKQEFARPNKSLVKFVFLLVLTILIIGAGWTGYRLLSTSENFSVTQFAVVDQLGQPVPNPQDYFRLEEELNLFSINIPGLVQDIQARHPQLAGVCIRKQFPNKITIVVSKRQPLAILVLRQSYFVDAEGVVFPFQTGVNDLPKIIGIPARQIQLYTKSDSVMLNKALSLLKQLKQAKVYPEHRITQIDLSNPVDIIFYIEDKIKVRMGQANFARKAVLLAKILAQLKEDNTVPKYIDMRFDSPVVRP